MEPIPDPRREAHETFRLCVDDIEVGTLWRSMSWAIDLTPGGRMVHGLGRAEAIDITEPA